MLGAPEERAAMQMEVYQAAVYQLTWEEFTVQLRGFALCSCLILLLSGVCQADVREDSALAYKLYVAAGACMAAYSGRYGDLAASYLEQDGWRIDHFVQTTGNVEARFLLAKKHLANGQQMYVLALAGTENRRDLQTDLKVDKVYFAGTTLESFATNAQKSVPDSEPKVHRGFHDLVQIGMTAKTRTVTGVTEYLTAMLLADPSIKIYLVGHSLGGAAATLAGARMISMGVRPEQIEVITFGAPPVGNAPFAAIFKTRLNLTRVVIAGDPVTGVLQTLVGGYKQFGREILWHLPASADQPHNLTEYGDLAIKNYYDKRQPDLAEGVTKLPLTIGKGKVYIVALKNSLPKSLTGDFGYMRQALADDYLQILPDSVIDDAPVVGNLRQKAAAAGCKWLIVQEVAGYRLKTQQNTYYIAFSQTVCDVTTGTVIKTEYNSSLANYLTPLEAFIHDFRGINYDWLKE